MTTVAKITKAQIETLRRMVASGGRYCSASVYAPRGEGTGRCLPAVVRALISKGYATAESDWHAIVTDDEHAASTAPDEVTP